MKIVQTGDSWVWEVRCDNPVDVRGWHTSGESCSDEATARAKAKTAIENHSSYWKKHRLIDKAEWERVEV